MSTYRVQMKTAIPLVCSRGDFLQVGDDGLPGFTAELTGATVFTNYGEADALAEEYGGEVQEFNEVEEQGAFQEDGDEA